MLLSARASTTLRFAIGTRVECAMEHEWKEGEIIAHFYVSPSFPKQLCMPYRESGKEGNKTAGVRTSGGLGYDAVCARPPSEWAFLGTR